MTVHRFAVYRDRFPFGSPEELGVVEAADHGAARDAAKRRWPGVPVIIRPAPRRRSASSAAYRAFLAEKRATLTNPNQTRGAHARSRRSAQAMTPDPTESA